MADVDLGALKFKIGLDDSSLDKQIRYTEEATGCL